VRNYILSPYEEVLCIINKVGGDRVAQLDVGPHMVQEVRGLNTNAYQQGPTNTIYFSCVCYSVLCMQVLHMSIGLWFGTMIKGRHCNKF
jgi:hypothetical protein